MKGLACHCFWMPIWMQKEEKKNHLKAHLSLISTIREEEYKTYTTVKSDSSVWLCYSCLDRPALPEPSCTNICHSSVLRCTTVIPILISGGIGQIVSLGETIRSCYGQIGNQWNVQACMNHLRRIIMRFHYVNINIFMLICWMHDPSKGKHCSSWQENEKKM